MEGVNIKTKLTIFGIICLICIFASLSSISASVDISANVELLDEDDPSKGAIVTDIPKGDAVNHLSVKNGDLLTSKSKAVYIKTGLRQKLSLRAMAKNYEGKNIKVTSAVWTFSDGSKARGLSTSKTFRKTGWYTVKMRINATGPGSYWGDNPSDNWTWIDSTKTFKIHVVNKADLKATKIMRSPASKDNTVVFRIIIKNYGMSDSKATQIRLGFADKKLSRFSQTVSVKPIKGVVYKKVVSKGKTITKPVVKSTRVDIQFKVPVKHQNKIKHLRIDPQNRLSESIKSNNLRIFR
ncbi:MAG: PKD domain-containing protein [Methanobrevibacter sp.]|nr:PKD domain-containing protein [Methanobrevibacter sp.]